MPNTLQDGTGKGYLAKVDSENHLHTSASVEQMVAHRSHYDASAFGISTPMLTLTTTGGRMLFLKNTDTRDFYITDLWFNWDGGATSHNRVMFGQLVFGDGVPTANNTVSAAGVLNRKTNNTAQLTVQYWDEVGDGMTGNLTGGAAFYWCNAQGARPYPIGGTIILGINDTMSVNLRGEEAGEASINILGFFR